jgi:hypothetical protein
VAITLMKCVRTSVEEGDQNTPANDDEAGRQHGSESNSDTGSSSDEDEESDIETTEDATLWSETDEVIHFDSTFLHDLLATGEKIPTSQMCRKVPHLDPRRLSEVVLISFLMNGERKTGF